MKLTGVYLSVLLLCIFCCALPAHAQLTAQCSPECYGPRFAADGLANTTLGQSGNTVSYRFRAHHTGSLQQIHVYLIVPPDAGYSGGSGGHVEITVDTDDGTSAHNPSSTVLASYLLTDYQSATPSTFFPIFTFTTPPSLVEGNLYHIVFSNPDSNPNTNFLSVDTLYVATPPSPWQPAVSDTDSAELLSRDGQTWSPRAGFLPILQLDFTDGWQEGMGYMESWIGAPQDISGSSNGVREQFTVSGTSRTVASVAVRVARISGSDPLRVLLKNGDGSVIEQGTIPASTFPTASLYTWASLQFASAHTLALGSQYSLELATESSSTYQTFPNRKGVAQNFASTTYYTDGYAQFKQNDSWVGWTQWGVTDRKDGDLQFYFEVNGTDTTSGSPSISNLTAENVTSNGAIVSWNTDQSASGQVQYGTTTAYSGSTTMNPTPATGHAQRLNGLAAGTLYHYRVLSMNALGNQAISGDSTFITSNGSDGIELRSMTNQALATVKAGETAKYGLQLVPNGFTGNVVIGCSGAPAGTSCTVWPASIAVTGNTPATLAVTVTTTAHANGIPSIGGSSFDPRIWILLTGIAGFYWAFRNLRGRLKLSFAVTTLLLVTLGGCGGNTGAGAALNGTPSGVSTLTVRAVAGSAQSAVPLTLVVD